MLKPLYYAIPAIPGNAVIMLPVHVCGSSREDTLCADVDGTTIADTAEPATSLLLCLKMLIVLFCLLKYYAGTCSNAIIIILLCWHNPPRPSVVWSAISSRSKDSAKGTTTYLFISTSMIRKHWK